MKSTDDIVRIVSFGGCVVVDSSKSVDDLVRIVSFAANSGARVRILGASRKSTEDLVRIAHFGKGIVEFDLTDLG